MDKFRQLEYRRPDFEAAGRQLTELGERAANAASYEEYRAVYLEVEDILRELRTASTIAHIRNTMDKHDEFYENEQKVITEQNAQLTPVHLRLSRIFTESPFRPEFDAEFGPYLMQAEEISLKLRSEAIIPEMIEEGELTRTYSRDAALCKTVFRGEECNFYGLLKHMESPDREERREAFAAWAALYESIADRLDDTYDKLVAVRVRKAAKLGFANFIDYIYPARGRYDYMPEDVEVFRRQVREVIVPFCSELFRRQKERLGVDRLHWYDEKLVYPGGNAVPQGTLEDKVETARRMYESMSPETGEFFRFMTEYELFDLETRPGKHLGGYCTFLGSYRAPFIFSNFNGTSADVDVLTHEAGHAFEAYTASRLLPLMSEVFSTSEVNEIHSMSMEFFAYPWMEGFFGENAHRYRYAHLCESVETVPYLVAVDVFQHRVFEQPDMTARERRAVWHEIEQTYLPWRDYEDNQFLGEGGFWMQKQHIFLYPFYYIDYALAQICAFQFLARAQEDREQAWQDYLKLCRSGGSRGYFDTLAYAGLDNPFREGTVEKVMQSVKSILLDFESKLDPAAR